MRIMAGGAIHFAVDVAFAAFQQLYLVAMDIQANGRIDACEIRQFKIGKGVAWLKPKRRTQHLAFIARMANRAHIHSACSRQRVEANYKSGRFYPWVTGLKIDMLRAWAVAALTVNAHNQRGFIKLFGTG